jgi:hypothetical protein
VTAERWFAVRTQLEALWNALASATSILESARNIRGRKKTVNDDERAEMTRLLGELRSPDALDGGSAASSAVREFLDTVEHINATVANALVPSLKAFDQAGAPIPWQMIDLMAIAACDPLSLTSDDIEVRTAEVAELAAIQANWPDAIAATSIRLDALRDAEQLAACTRTRAEQTVLAGPLPSPSNAERDLRAQLDSLSTPDPGALRELGRCAELALRQVQRDEALARGLLERLSELEGRLKAYEAKAARFGLAEDPDLLSSRRIASGLLSRRPCDLRAVTRAVADYQKTLGEKPETAR